MGEATMAEMEVDAPCCLARWGRWGHTYVAPARLKAWEAAAITMIKAVGGRARRNREA